MKVTVVGPYARNYVRGYVRIRKDGRRVIDLVNSHEDRTTVSYARYLLTIKEGRFLNSWEEADHINTDHTDDSIDNLQVLTTEEHIAKSTLEQRGTTYVICVCAYCGLEFERESRQFYKGYARTFCSRSCNGKFYYGSGLSIPSVF